MRLVGYIDGWTGLANDNFYSYCPDRLVVVRLAWAMIIFPLSRWIGQLEVT